MTKKKFHKNLADFFPRYLYIDVENKLLVGTTPYKCCQNLLFNLIFVQSFRSEKEGEDLKRKMI